MTTRATPTDSEGRPLLRLQDAARLAGMNRGLFSNAVYQDPRLVSFLVDGRRLFARADVLAYVQARTDRKTYRVSR